MSIRFRCPFCKKPLKLVNADKLGQPMQCPGCSKWIIFNENGLPQQPAPVAVPPVTRPQPKGEVVRFDEPREEPVAPRIQHPAAPVRRRSFDRRREDEEDFVPDEPTNLPPDLPPMFENGDSIPPPIPTRKPTRPGTPPIPPPPRSTQRRSAIDDRRGGNKTLLIAILLLGLIGLGVGSYFAFFRPEKGFVKKDYGIIEISTTSVKAIVVRPFPVDDSYNFEMVNDYDSIKMGAGRMQEDGKSFDPETLEKALKSVKDFQEKIQKEYNLPNERIAVIRSSGVVAGFRDLESLRNNQKILENKVYEKTGIQLAALSPEDEAKYITRFVVPQRDLGQALMLDVGGGNIKGGYFDEANFFRSTDVAIGTSRFTEEVRKALKENKGDFAAKAKELAKPLVLDKLRFEIDNRPGLNRKPKIYLCGGILWVLRTFTHPDVSIDDRLLVDLAADDIDKLRKLAASDSLDDVFKAVRSEVGDESLKPRLDKELENISKKFKLEEIRAGVEILAALSEAYEFPKKQLLFYTKGPTAPNMGFLLYRVGLVK